MIKYIEIMEKDAEILKSKLELSQIDNSSLKRKLNLSKIEKYEPVSNSRYVEQYLYCIGIHIKKKTVGETLVIDIRKIGSMSKATGVFISIGVGKVLVLTTGL
jgi:hypothetical protein